MPIFDFHSLFEKYPGIIASMPDDFTSHEFILRLAHTYQTLYVEALYAYRVSTHLGTPAPFQFVHAFLSRHLGAYPDLIEQIRADAPSHDIFGQSNLCTEWRKR